MLLFLILNVLTQLLANRSLSRTLRCNRLNAKEPGNGEGLHTTTAHRSPAYTTKWDELLELKMSAGTANGIKMDSDTIF